MAAFDASAKPADYYGPDGFMELRGNPALVKSAPLSYNVDKAGQLWEQSQKLTGISY